MIKINPYIANILSQPTALREALDHYPSGVIDALHVRLAGGEFDRIVLTGMGSSYNGAYPAWLKLGALPAPSLLVNTAELLNYGRERVGARTLLWMNSQSGRSAEIVRMLELIAAERPACLLSMTNDLDSPLGQQADVAAPIHAGDEGGVSTKTYINMTAVLTLAAVQLVGGDWQALRTDMHRAADAMDAYLTHWQEHVAELEYRLGEVDQLLILGRGPSMGAVRNGSLICKEAAKCAFEGMHAADFRHGPLELAGPRLTLLVFEGPAQTAALNRDLAVEAADYDTRVLWLSPNSDHMLTTLRLPDVAEDALPVVEILPLQMLTLVMAQRNGIEPGVFRHIDKVTLQL
jgi:glucosamine--fructose-6-phosphate aminotransferase (isomerizing)